MLLIWLVVWTWQLLRSSGIIIPFLGMENEQYLKQRVMQIYFMVIGRNILEIPMFDCKTRRLICPHLASPLHAKDRCNGTRSFPYLVAVSRDPEWPSKRNHTSGCNHQQRGHDPKWWFSHQKCENHPLEMGIKYLVGNYPFNCYQRCWHKSTFGYQTHRATTLTNSKTDLKLCMRLG